MANQVEMREGLVRARGPDGKFVMEELPVEKLQADVEETIAPEVTPKKRRKTAFHQALQAELAQCMEAAGSTPEKHAVRTIMRKIVDGQPEHR